MVIKNYIHIAFVLFAIQTVSFSQNYSDDEYDVFTEDANEFVQENESGAGYPYSDESTTQKEVQEEYLRTPIEKKRFNRNKWNNLRRQAVEEALGEGGSYQDNESPYGSEQYTQRENPYEQEQESYERYWDQKQENSKEFKKRPKKIENSPTPKSNRSNGSSFELSPVVGYILIGVIIALLAGLIFYLFYKNPPSNETKKIPKDITDINPVEIPKTELELRLEEALNNKDYRKAIRIYFIFIIRGLSEKNWIQWEKEKTNFAYLNEMRKNPLHQEFDESVMLYEIVWYGKRKVDADTYYKLEPTFKSLIKKIDK